MEDQRHFSKHFLVFLSTSHYALEVSYSPADPQPQFLHGLTEEGCLVSEGSWFYISCLLFMRHSHFLFREFLCNSFHVCLYSAEISSPKNNQSYFLYSPDHLALLKRFSLSQLNAASKKKKKKKSLFG